MEADNRASQCFGCGDKNSKRNKRQVGQHQKRGQEGFLCPEERDM